jgi:hypothetical protein
MAAAAGARQGGGADLTGSAPDPRGRGRPKPAAFSIAQSRILESAALRPTIRVTAWRKVAVGRPLRPFWAIAAFGAVRNEPHVRKIPELVQLRKHCNDCRALAHDGSVVGQDAVHFAAGLVQRIGIAVAQKCRATARKTSFARSGLLRGQRRRMVLRSYRHVRSPVIRVASGRRSDPSEK